MKNFSEKVNFIWNIANKLRGPYKKEQYGQVILPMAVLRRFDCVLEATKDAVRKEYIKLKNTNLENLDPFLNEISGQKFNNISEFTFQKLIDTHDQILDNFLDYIQGFSKNAREIIEYFDFEKEIRKMDKNNLLYLVISEFNEIDLHPEVVSNIEMGYIFEELIRRFSEHGEAGDHYTPREVIRLMVNLLFIKDEDILAKEGITRTLYDCCAGTGGMGSVAEEYLKELNEDAELIFFAQEINPESYGICKADILIKGQDDSNIKLGDTLADDAFKNKKFNYMITNPPYGVEWKAAEKAVKDEYEDKGFDGRFGAGLPRINDGQLLFLQNLVSKMDEKEGSRIAIVMNGSPLFTGDAGSGESEIRRWLIENDYVEGIVALPNQLFYNTGISTYVWILTNTKSEDRQGKIQLVDVSSFFVKMKKSLGNKRNEISKEQIDEITRLYGEYIESQYCKKFDNEDFGYSKITVERPLRLNFILSEERIERLKEQTAFVNLAKTRRKGEKGLAEIKEGKLLQEKILSILTEGISDVLYQNRDEFTKVIKNLFKDTDIKINASLLKAILNALSEKDETADICVDKKGNPEPDADLRDTENVPLKEDIHEYFEREVKPHVPDAWIDESKTKIGYEIPFTRYFYKYTPLRPSEEIKNEIIELENMIQEKIKKVLG